MRVVAALEYGGYSGINTNNNTGNTNNIAFDTGSNRVFNTILRSVIIS